MLLLFVLLFCEELKANKANSIQNIPETVVAQNQASKSDSAQKSEIAKDTSESKQAQRTGHGKKMRNGRCGRNDKFVDKDGDGINDNRCKGSGFCRQKKKKKCCPRAK